jgi:hypothetical protein
LTMHTALILCLRSFAGLISHNSSAYFCFTWLQVEDNLGALAVVEKLTPEIMEKIEQAMDTKPSPPPTYR